MKFIKEYGLLIIIIILLIGLLIINNFKEEKMYNIKLNIVPTNISKIDDNSVWCPTFQLIWNDLKNKVIGDNIVFLEDEDNIYANDLNKESFNEKMISDEYYYKNFGYMTNELKEIIKYDIKEKFNEESDILDRVNFNDNSRDYFFYAMLVRNFNFKHPFDILSKKTFGITKDSKEELDENIKVLFYNKDSYAVKLLTTSKDEVILYKGNIMDNFKNTYQEIINKVQEEDFKSDDTITIANLSFKSETQYQELLNKSFYDINGISYVISDAIQTIIFNLDNKGGKVKSEASMGVRLTSLNYGRHFDFTDNFVLFLKEEDREKPYLALNVSNINEFIE